MGQERIVRWVQIGHDGTSPGAHVDGASAGDYTPAPSPNPEDPAPNPIPLIWRWRTVSESRADPLPDLTYYRGASADFTIGSASRQPIRRTYFVDVAEGQYEVRLRRNSPDETDVKAVSDVVIGQVKSVQRDTANYYGRTLTALRIRATSQLNGVLQNVSGFVVQNACYIKSGGSYLRAASSNPGRQLYAWLRGGFDPDGNRLWGAGLPDARIDVEGIDAWANWCSAHSLDFDFVIDSAMTVQQVAQHICRCGRGALSTATGKFGVTYDAENLPVTATFTPSNIKQGSFNISYQSGDVPDGVTLRYLDRSTWQQNQVVVKAPGVTAPEHMAEADIVGCTNTGQAAREANLMLAQNLYRGRTVTWEADAEGLTVRRGDVVSLSHNLMDWGDSGRLIAGTTGAVTLDREVTLSGAQQYLSVVTPEGDYSVHRVTVGTGSTAALTLIDALPSAPNDGVALDWRYQFDAAATPGWRVKIFDIAPGAGFEGVKFSAYDDVPEYYASVSGNFSRVLYRAAARPMTISGLRIGEELQKDGSAWLVRLALKWFSSGDIETVRIRYSRDGAAWVDAGFFANTGAASIVLPFVSGNVRVVAVAYNGVGSPVMASASHTLALWRDKPPRVPYFLINDKTLTWGDVVTPDMAGYRIKWQPGTNTSWFDANELHTGLLTDSPYVVKIHPVGAFTLLIRAVDVFGNESAESAVIRSGFGDALVSNVVELIEHAPTWPGDKTGCTVVSGDLLADDAGDAMWAPDDRSAMWGSGAALMWGADVWEAMTYATTITPAVIKEGASLVVHADIVGDSWSLKYRMSGTALMWSATDTDLMWGDETSPVYGDGSDWLDWPGSMVLADNIDYDFVVSIAQSSPVQSGITRLDFMVDNPDIDESFDDVAISSGGTRLPITGDYDVIKNVSCTLQDDGGTAVSLRVIDKSAASGPLIKCYNTAGTAVAGTIDARIQGY